ncbi:MAG: hypothetical protein ACM31G_09685 [Flavobacteriales bacterium]
MAIKETFLKKYGVSEYLVLLAGLCIMARAVYSLIMLNLKATSWEEIAMIISIFCLGFLAVKAPFALLEFSRARLGMETKKEKLEKKEKELENE